MIDHNDIACRKLADDIFSVTRRNGKTQIYRTFYPSGCQLLKETTDDILNVILSANGDAEFLTKGL